MVAKKKATRRKPRLNPKGLLKNVVKRQKTMDKVMGRKKKK